MAVRLIRFLWCSHLDLMQMKRVIPSCVTALCRTSMMEETKIWRDYLNISTGACGTTPISICIHFAFNLAILVEEKAFLILYKIRSCSSLISRSSYVSLAVGLALYSGGKPTTRFISIYIRLAFKIPIQQRTMKLNVVLYHTVHGHIADKSEGEGYGNKGRAEQNTGQKLMKHIWQEIKLNLLQLLWRWTCRTLSAGSKLLNFSLYSLKLLFELRPRTSIYIGQ